MISLLPVGRVIAMISVSYALVLSLVLALASQIGAETQNLSSTIKIVVGGATALQLLLMAWFYLGWRYFWRWFPALNRLLFPDIAGEWKIRINWEGQGSGGVVDAEATIRQDFLKVSMEVRSPKSDSQTLIAQPKRDPESGTPLLFYVYLVVPKAMGTNPSSPYYGAAILRFAEANGGELKGNYWTTQKTGGHFQLGRKHDRKRKSRVGV